MDSESRHHHEARPLYELLLSPSPFRGFGERLRSLIEQDPAAVVADVPGIKVLGPALNLRLEGLRRAGSSAGRRDGTNL